MKAQQSADSTQSRLGAGVSEKHRQSDKSGNQDYRFRPETTSTQRTPKRSKSTPQFALPFASPSDGVNFSEREQLQLLLSSLPLIFLVINREMRIVLLRGKDLETLAPSGRDLVGHPFYDLFSDFENTRRLIAQALEGTAVSGSSKIGDREFAMKFSPIRGREMVIDGALGLGIEVLDHRQPLANVEGAHPPGTSDHVREGGDPEVQKPEKGQQFARASHELRAPLNSIVGFTNLLLNNSDPELSAQERFYLERILGNATHLLGVVGDMLDLSVIETGKQKIAISETDLTQLVAETLSELKRLDKESGIEIRVEIPGETRPMETDRQKLKQVLINLLVNASKFTREGSITVSVHIDEFSRPVRIDVSDTGDGIQEDKLEKIFEAFERGSQGSQQVITGTGLGLTISRSLCAAMGYKLTAKSTLGKGSTFSIELSPPPAAASA